MRKPNWRDLVEAGSNSYRIGVQGLDWMGGFVSQNLFDGETPDSEGWPQRGIPSITAVLMMEIFRQTLWGPVAGVSELGGLHQRVRRHRSQCCQKNQWISGQIHSGAEQVALQGSLSRASNMQQPRGGFSGVLVYSRNWFCSWLFKSSLIPFGKLT